MHADPRECFECLKEPFCPSIGCQLKEKQNNSWGSNNGHIDVQRRDNGSNCIRTHNLHQPNKPIHYRIHGYPIPHGELDRTGFNEDLLGCNDVTQPAVMQDIDDLVTKEGRGRVEYLFDGGALGQDEGVVIEFQQ